MLGKGKFEEMDVTKLQVGKEARKYVLKETTNFLH